MTALHCCSNLLHCTQVTNATSARASFRHIHKSLQGANGTRRNINILITVPDARFLMVKDSELCGIVQNISLESTRDEAIEKIVSGINTLLSMRSSQCYAQSSGECDLDFNLFDETCPIQDLCTRCDAINLSMTYGFNPPGTTLCTSHIQTNAAISLR